MDRLYSSFCDRSCAYGFVSLVALFEAKLKFRSLWFENFKLYYCVNYVQYFLAVCIVGFFYYLLFS